MIVSVNTLEELPVKFESPLYVAVIECAPGNSPLNVMRAGPPLKSVAVAKVLVPSSKVTVPLGVPPAAGVIVMTKLTGRLTTAGFGVAVTVVLVVA